MQQQTPPEQFDLPGLVADLNSLLRLKTTVIGMKMFATVDEMVAIPKIRRPTESLPQLGWARFWRDLFVSLFRRHKIEIVRRQGAIDEGLLMVARLPQHVAFAVLGAGAALGDRVGRIGNWRARERRRIGLHDRRLKADRESDRSQGEKRPEGKDGLTAHEKDDDQNRQGGNRQHVGDRHLNEAPQNLNF